MERTVIENSGLLIDDEQKAKFVIMKDGINPKIWDENGDERRFIHYRFILECLKEGTMLSSTEAMHLLPLPHQVPIKCFSKVCLELALIKLPIDNIIFPSLVKLYGFKRQFKE